MARFSTVCITQRHSFGKVEEIFSNRQKTWHYLNETFEQVHEFLPDQGQPDGIRKMRKLTSSWTLSERLKKNGSISLFCDAGTYSRKLDIVLHAVK